MTTSFCPQCGQGAESGARFCSSCGAPLDQSEPKRKATGGRNWTRDLGLIVGLPVVLNTVPEALGVPIHSSTVEHLNIMIVGSLIIFFLIIEPHGLARLWALIREKLVIWPFPH